MTALPKIRRRIFFYASLAAFVVIAPFLILYSLGYTLDMRQRTVKETGGIFIKTNQAGFTVSLNPISMNTPQATEGKKTLPWPLTLWTTDGWQNSNGASNGAIEKSTILARGLLLGNLLPGQYRLHIKKDGHQSWKRIVSVTQFNVREIRDIILLPDPLIQETTALWNEEENFERAFVSPAAQYAAISIRNKTTKKQSLLFFKTSENKITARLPMPAIVEEITWNTEENMALLKTAGQKTEYTLVVLSDAPPRQTTILKKSITVSDNAARRITPTDIQKIKFGNEPNDFVILTDTGTLLSWNTATTSAALLTEGVKEFEILGEEVFFIAKNGFAARQSLRDPATTVNLGRKGFAFSEDSIKIIRSHNSDIFLKDGADGLFFLPRGDNEEFELLETGVEDIALADKEEKLFFRKQNAIGVFHLEENRYQPFEKRGEKTILFESRDTTFLDADWYTEDDAHIILNTSSGVFLLDVDTRGGPRIVELDAKPAKKIFWNQDEKKLYLIRDAAIEALTIE